MWFLLLAGLNKHLFEVLTERGKFVFTVTFRKIEVIVMLSISNMSFKKHAELQGMAMSQR